MELMLCRPKPPLYAIRLICTIVQVYAVIDRDVDGIADSVVTVISNLPAPLGIAYANGSLWVATTPTIYRFDNVDELALAGMVSLWACSTLHLSLTSL